MSRIYEFLIQDRVIFGRPACEAVLAQAVADLVAALGQPSRLGDVDGERSHFDAIARGAMQNMMVRSNPRPVTSEADIHQILELAW
jgi:alcohol dehydrogenase class IV